MCKEEEHVVFNFTYLKKDNTKITNQDFLKEIREMSKYKFKDLSTLSKQKCGYGREDAEKLNVTKEYPLEYMEHFEVGRKKMKKVDYFRIGRQHRLYGELRQNIFYAFLYAKKE